MLVLLSCAVDNALLAVTESAWWPLAAAVAMWAAAAGVTAWATGPVQRGGRVAVRDLTALMRATA